jgi:hypothetical protein
LILAALRPRAHLAEFGIVAPVGRSGVEALLEVVANANDTRLPEIARACVAALGTQLLELKTQWAALFWNGSAGRSVLSV